MERRNAERSFQDRRGFHLWRGRRIFVSRFVPLALVCSLRTNALVPSIPFLGLLDLETYINVINPSEKRTEGSMTSARSDPIRNSNPCNPDIHRTPLIKSASASNVIDTQIIRILYSSGLQNRDLHLRDAHLIPPSTINRLSDRSFSFIPDRSIYIFP